jgi:hypothetical protein
VGSAHAKLLRWAKFPEVALGRICPWAPGPNFPQKARTKKQVLMQAGRWAIEICCIALHRF